MGDISMKLTPLVQLPTEDQSLYDTVADCWSGQTSGFSCDAARPR